MSKIKGKQFAIFSIIPVMVLLSVLGFTSCDLESSDNGDLDGYWHLESIDSLENGNTVQLSESRIFWGIEHKLILAREYNLGKDQFYFRFVQTSDSLTITKVYLNHWHQDHGDDGGDIPVDEVTPSLRYYGVNQIPERFYKEALSGSKMILRSKTLRLNFKKF